MQKKENFQNKNGRPPLPDDKKQIYAVQFRLTKSEYFALKAKADEAGYSLSDYMRSCAANSQVIERLKPHHMAMFRNLVGIGNNLNQIAKKANQAGYSTVETELLNIKEVLAQAMKIIVKKEKK